MLEITGELKRYDPKNLNNQEREFLIQISEFIGKEMNFQPINVLSTLNYKRYTLFIVRDENKKIVGATAFEETPKEIFVQYITIKKIYEIKKSESLCLEQSNKHPKENQFQLISLKIKKEHTFIKNPDSK